MAVIELVHLEKRFGAHEVLRGVDLSVEQGEVLSVIGASGSGKSTMLRCINLLETPTAGQVRYRGQAVTERTVNLPQYRARVGMVFQSFNLFHNMTALENCIVGQTSVLGRKRPEARENAMRYLEQVGMTPYIHAKPAQLSGGQKQRVAIARMLMQRAPIMVFDDSLSAVDAETDAKIRAALHESLGKATVLLISHRVTTLMQADCILVLDGGRVSELGTHAELIAKPGIYRDIYDIQMSSDDRRLLGKEGV